MPISQDKCQRVTIAYGLVAQTKIIKFDKAIRSVKPRTDEQIQEGLWKLIRDQTSFSIPESLATILNSVKIVAYNAGEIVNNPLHDELMARKGFYYALHMSQVKGKALAGAEIVVYYVAIGH